MDVASSASDGPGGGNGLRSDAGSVLVVPCFNEAGRLDDGEILRLAGRFTVWLVDDGSTDATRSRLHAIATASGGRVEARANASNLGKAETVRRHLLEACDAGASVVGYYDADLATPVDEMFRLLARLEAGDADAVTGARVGLSGRDIRRDASRHYTGRVFSTVASLAMGAPYYDTQCGAKVFRVSGALRAALAEPFRSRWAFDVELLGRLLAGGPGAAPVPPRRLVEEPLQAWHDIGGSKLTMLDAWKSGVELLLIWRDLGARRRRGGDALRRFAAK